jgi:hypothetical protein
MRAAVERAAIGTDHDHVGRAGGMELEIARGIERDDAARCVLMHDEQLAAADRRAVRNRRGRRCRCVTNRGDRRQAAGNEGPASYQVRHGIFICSGETW